MGITYPGDFVPRLRGIYILGCSGVASSVSSGTAEVQLASIDVPANLLGANGKIRVTTLWTYTNSVNNKILRVRLGGSGGSAYLAATVTTTASMQAQTIIANNNATNVQKGFNGNTASFATTSNALVTGAVDTTAATTLYMSGQPASGGEVITLEGYVIEIIPGVS